MGGEGKKSAMGKKREQVKIGSKEFYELRDKWYKKLEQSGFKDLEYAGTVGKNSPYLKHKDLMSLKYRIQNGKAKRELYLYSVLERFIMHNKRWAWGRNRWMLPVARFYVKGYSYRKIIRAQKEGKLRCTEKLSLPKLTMCIKTFIAKAFEWNAQSPDGVRMDEIMEISYLQAGDIRDPL